MSKNVNELPKNAEELDGHVEMHPIANQIGDEKTDPLNPVSF